MSPCGLLWEECILLQLACWLELVELSWMHNYESRQCAQRGRYTGDKQVIPSAISGRLKEMIRQVLHRHAKATDKFFPPTTFINGGWYLKRISRQHKNYLLKLHKMEKKIKVICQDFHTHILFLGCMYWWSPLRLSPWQFSLTRWTTSKNLLWLLLKIPTIKSCFQLSLLSHHSY